MKNQILCLIILVSGLAGCVVPLKKPPIIPLDQRIEPKINFGRLIPFAEAAALAYETDAAVQAAYPGQELIIRTMPKTDGRAFIVLDHARREQTISIRGTANKETARMDLKSLKVYDSSLNIYVHQGFLQSENEVSTEIKQFLRPDYKTRIVGHSLGGAVAVLFMMELMNEGYPVEEVITFGQPKVTNEEGVDLYQAAPLLRIICGDDIVAHVPPSNLVFDLSGPYQHCGPEILLLKEGGYQYNPQHDPKDFMTNDNWKNLQLNNAVDHQMINYLEQLKKLE